MNQQEFEVNKKREDHQIYKMNMLTLDMLASRSHLMSNEELNKIIKGE